jgi:predicted DNA-binding transcriptional regulator AlpA
MNVKLADLINIEEVRVLFGGEKKPIDPATVYRHIRDGIIPRPVHIGRLSRWLRSECEASLSRMIEERV